MGEPCPAGGPWSFLCKQDLICLGDPPNYYQFWPLHCHPAYWVERETAVCSLRLEEGQYCQSPGECADGLGCLSASPSEPYRCSLPQDAPLYCMEDTACGGKRKCLGADSEVRIDYAVCLEPGTSHVGEPCGETGDCVDGSTCTDVYAASPSECVDAQHVAHACVAPGEEFFPCDDDEGNRDPSLCKGGLSCVAADDVEQLTGWFLGSHSLCWLASPVREDVSETLDVPDVWEGDE